MKVLVTGADGFVGRYLVQALRDRSDEVVAAVRPGCSIPSVWRETEDTAPVDVVPFELADPQSTQALAGRLVDAVVHLAAMASGAEARAEPVEAWKANVLGTVGFLEALGQQPGGDQPRVILVSSAEVYGAGGPAPRTEADPPRPISPYAASKAAAELGALEIARRTGLPLVIARPFPHTGVGQSPTYVVPGFLARLLEARRTGAATVLTGNLDPVRDFLDVRDVVSAYLALLDGGAAGETYNVASGKGYSVRQIFAMLADLVGVNAEPEVAPDLARPTEIAYLVGDATRLRQVAGWHPHFSFEQTLGDMVHAQAN